MKKYDVVIIGGGLGGLLCGYILSKEGRKVCVLEKNADVGGCLRSFKFDGCDFASCVYYFGGYDKGQNLWQYFKYFGLSGKLNVTRMDQNGFDKISFIDGDKDYSIAMGYDNYIDILSREFPSERSALKEYLNKIRETNAGFPLYNLDASPESLLNQKNLGINAREYIHSVTKDARLRGVLAGENMMYAGVSDQTPLYVHSLITGSLMQSAWRFCGGSAQLASLLSGSITAAGGEIITACEVVKITASGDKVDSVAIKDGRTIEADNFISDIHPALTIEMINGSGSGRLYRERIFSLENTVSAFMLYVTFKKDKVKPAGHNCYIYSDENVWDTANYQENLWPRSCIVRFPGQEKNITYQKSANVVAYMKYEEVKKWEQTQAGNRGGEYSDFKEGKAGQLLSFIERKWPGFKDNIRAYTASTPLTLKGYTGTIGGAIYGLLKSSRDPVGSLVLPKTKISNLYLTGQNIFLHGLLGVTTSSVLTCSELLGYEYLVNKIINS